MNQGEITLITPGRGSLRDQAAELLRFGELLYFLVWKNLKVRYAQAVLGAAWAVLQPVLTALLVALLLGRVSRMPTGGAPPFLFYLTAMVPWTFFATAVTGAATSLVSNQPLITKVYFPRICLPISAILSALVDIIVPLAFLFLVAVWYGRLHVSLEMLFLPVLLFVATATAAGLGTGLAALNLQYRDVNHALPFLIQTLFFASPVIYAGSQLPTKLRIVFALNPMASVLDGFRAILLQNHPLSLEVAVIGVVSATVMLVIGIAYFERVQHRFADVA
jgi:lipopolysaccharide transport system permease protein